MKTVFFANVDGYDIVLGFGEAQLDPVTTDMKIAADLKASDEAKAIDALNAQIDALHAQQRFASSMAIFNQLQAQIDELATQFPALGEALDAKRASLRAASAVYFTPSGKENLITDEQQAALLALVAPHSQVRLDGTAIADWRGSSYWAKDTTSGLWTNTVITKLGDTVPTGVTMEADLTDANWTEIRAQVEADRVAALTDAQRLTEAQGAVAAAKASAAQSYNEELIAGTDAATALTDSQAALKAQLAAINAKYGTSLT